MAIVIVSILIAADDTGLLVLGDDAWLRAREPEDFRATFRTLALLAACACAVTVHAVHRLVKGDFDA